MIEFFFDTDDFVHTFVRERLRQVLTDGLAAITDDMVEREEKDVGQCIKHPERYIRESLDKG